MNKITKKELKNINSGYKKIYKSFIGLVKDYSKLTLNCFENEDCEIKWLMPDSDGISYAFYWDGDTWYEKVPLEFILNKKDWTKKYQAKLEEEKKLQEQKLVEYDFNTIKGILKRYPDFINRIKKEI